MREIAFLEMPGFGINRLWWPGGRYAYVVGAFRRLHRSHPRASSICKNITKPEIVSRWWLPGMNRAAGETPTLPQGQARRAASHDHRRQSRLRRVARRRLHDPRHQRSGAARSCCRTSTGRRRFPAARTRRCRCRAATSRSWPTKRMREKCAKGTVLHLRRRRARAGESGADLDAADTDGPRLLRARHVRSAQSAREPARARSRARTRSSRPTTMPACACSTSGTQFAPKEIAYWVPPAPAKLIDPRPNVALAAKTCRRLRHDRRPDVCQRLERRHARAAVRRMNYPIPAAAQRSDPRTLPAAPE